jgi:hypothetical protein
MRVGFGVTWYGEGWQGPKDNVSAETWDGSSGTQKYYHVGCQYPASASVGRPC